MLRAFPSRLLRRSGLTREQVSRQAPLALASSVLSHASLMPLSLSRFAHDSSAAASSGVSSSRTSTTAKLWRQRAEAAESGKDGTLPPFIIRKKPSDSYMAIELPLASDVEVRRQYESFDGGVRLGKILEDLDAFAANVSHSHADDNNPDTRPLRLVTAAFDRIDMIKAFPLDRDITMTGYVTWVGRTSMQTTCLIVDQDKTPILVAQCLMVAQDEATNKSAPVNQLEPETQDEIDAFKVGEDNKARRIQESKQSLKNVVPNPEEVELIHRILMRGPRAVHADSNQICLQDSGVQSTLLTEPQDMNRSQKIFGGYLMRKAYELALANVHVYAGAEAKPQCIAIDDIAFLRPVEIGSTITFDSKIVYVPLESSLGTGPNACQVRVDTLVHVTGGGHSHAGRAETFTSNTFHFTFACPGMANTHHLARIAPTSYEDAMTYLDGRRRFIRSRDIAIAHKSELAKYYPNTDDIMPDNEAGVSKGKSGKA